MNRYVLTGIAVSGLFWVLLAHGWWIAELSRRRVAIFVILWVVGLVGFPYLAFGRSAFTAWIAVLDIALILMIFKRDFKIRRWPRG